MKYYWWFMRTFGIALALLCAGNAGWELKAGHAWILATMIPCTFVNLGTSWLAGYSLRKWHR